MYTEYKKKKPEEKFIIKTHSDFKLYTAKKKKVVTSS